MRYRFVPNRHFGHLSLDGIYYISQIAVGIRLSVLKITKLGHYLRRRRELGRIQVPETGWTLRPARGCALRTQHGRGLPCLAAVRPKKAGPSVLSACENRMLSDGRRTEIGSPINNLLLTWRPLPQPLKLSRR